MTETTGPAPDGPLARRERIAALVAARGTARVSDLAAELGAAPVTVRRDVEALALAGRLHRRHGVVSAARPDATALGRVVAIGEPSGYLGEILRGADAAVAAHGGRYVLEVARDEASTRAAVERAAGAPDVSGILYAPRWRTPDELAADVVARTCPPHVPLVLVERFAPRGSLLAQRDAVRSDHATGVHQALSHLRANGHRRIVAFCRDDSPTARTLRGCFPEALRSLGLPVLSEPLLSSDGADPAHRAQAPDPAEAVRRLGATALLVHSDTDALSLVPRLVGAGLRVPDDVSVVAYDDVVAGLGDVRLSAVAPPKREVGRAAVDLLAWRASAPDAPCRHLEIAPHLVERHSVRPVEQR
ncbi:substrate-binding domain-containing protein [Kineococcus rhizosphaerae]|uniref:DNA-binding LacI/PurR family transcriptional regulator n=1 Tax=Kineococcus rhizosphaerae TaxID=559628 RepID=A0A2T0R4S3_9ACTN|nr:substrate-binding domain-containing protein [Kineococcus rhizosphaerae]PRY15310.1 DNA-binding LacI/PurR family transcriptional regulator [Kineococcus rhizosphaerae]